MSFQGNIVVFSEFVHVHGKACLAGKTHSIRPAHGAGPGSTLSKRHNAVHGRGQTHPKGAPLMSRHGVAALTNGTTIGRALRLVAKHQGIAEHDNIT